MCCTGHVGPIVTVPVMPVCPDGSGVDVGVAGRGVSVAGVIGSDEPPAEPGVSAVAEARVVAKPDGVLTSAPAIVAGTVCRVLVGKPAPQAARKSAAIKDGT